MLAAPQHEPPPSPPPNQPPASPPFQRLAQRAGEKSKRKLAREQERELGLDDLLTSAILISGPSRPRSSLHAPARWPETEISMREKIDRRERREHRQRHAALVRAQTAKFEKQLAVAEARALIQGSRNSSRPLSRLGNHMESRLVGTTVQPMHSGGSAMFVLDESRGVEVYNTGQGTYGVRLAAGATSRPSNAGKSLRPSTRPQSARAAIPSMPSVSSPRSPTTFPHELCDMSVASRRPQSAPAAWQARPDSVTRRAATPAPPSMQALVARGRSWGEPASWGTPGWAGSSPIAGNSRWNGRKNLATNPWRRAPHAPRF